jgi:hypothetical protein
LLGGALRRIAVSATPAQDFGVIVYTQVEVTFSNSMIEAFWRSLSSAIRGPARRAARNFPTSRG